MNDIYLYLSPRLYGMIEDTKVKELGFAKKIIVQPMPRAFHVRAKRRSQRRVQVYPMKASGA